MSRIDAAESLDAPAVGALKPFCSGSSTRIPHVDILFPVAFHKHQNTKKDPCCVVEYTLKADRLLFWGEPEGNAAMPQ